MECLDTTKSLKINLKKNINTVLIVVEGSKDEFDLFKHIFRDILHYKYVEKKRGQAKLKEYNEFIMKGNENSKIIVVNTSNSNIGSIRDKNYRNNLYIMLYEKYGLDIKNIPVYYVWDRDCDSNSAIITRNLLKKLGNAYENEDYENGLLLLSYPALEVYTISSFDSKVQYLDSKLKKYIKNKGYSIDDIDQNTIKKAVISMHKRLLELGIENYDLDNFKVTNLDIFEKEEKIYKDKNKYILLSTISIILLDLGIITEREGDTL